MTRDSIKKKLEKIRAEIATLQKKEKELAAAQREIEDAENLKIIKKHQIKPEQLIFLNGLKEEEIAMILKKRKEEEELAGEREEKKGNNERTND